MPQGKCGKSAHTVRRLLVLGAPFLVFFALATPSRAGATNLSIARFDPTPANDSLFSVDSAQIGPFKLAARLTLDWAHNPLVLYSDNRTAFSVVENQVFGNLGLAIALWDRVSFSVDVPVALVQTGRNPTFETLTFSSPRGVHISDLRLGGRVRLFSALSGLLSMSIGGFVWLPLGSSSSDGGAYASDAFVRGKAELLLGGQQDRIVWAIAAAIDLRRAQTYLEVTQ